MATGSSGYIDTPWGFYTQQQFVFSMLLSYMVLDGRDITSGTDVNNALINLQAFYDIAWPGIENMVL